MESTSSHLTVVRPAKVGERTGVGYLSPAAVKKWLDEDCPVIAARAKAEGAEVH